MSDNKPPFTMRNPPQEIRNLFPELEPTKKRRNLTIGDLVLQNENAPTRDELIQIAQNLSNERQLDRVTRNAFRESTGISDQSWAAHFGTFPAFMEAAGLNSTATTRKIAGQIARHSRQDDFRKLSIDRLNWHDRFERRSDQRFQTMLACSDIHDIEADPFAVRMFVQAVADVQPDIICINGDLFDLPEFSRHPKDPREWNVTGRIEAGLNFIHQLRNVAPDAQIDLIEGNHEARLLKFMFGDGTQAAAIASMLSDLHGWDVRRLFKLDEYEVNYIARGDLCAFTDSQLRAAVQTSERIYWGFVLARHHPPSKKNAVTLPGFNGHHHTHSVSSHYNHRLGSFEWHQTGGLHKRQASYTQFHESDMRWNCGFLLADADVQNERVNFTYATVGDTFTRFGGRHYRRETDEFYPGLEAELRTFRTAS